MAQAASQVRSRPVAGTILVAVSAAVVVAFLAATAFSQHSAANIDAAADSIITNAMPSVQYLGAARTNLRRLEAGAERYAVAIIAGEAPEDEWLDEPRQSLDAALEAYLALPFYPGEQEMYKGTAATLGRMYEQIGRIKVLRAGNAGAPRPLLAMLRAQTAQVDSDLEQTMDFDAAQGQRLSAEITAVRHRAADLAWILNSGCLLLAVAATVLAVREVRRSAAVLRALGQAQRERADLLEQRCVELEHFADRVAHDIMSPLGGVSIALSVAQKGTFREPEATRIVDRAMHALHRVRRIVDGLLEFARSGARPRDDAAADVRTVLDDVVEGVRGDAQQLDIELRIEPFEPCRVGCSPGVLTSIVANLVRNAIKYMGRAQLRQIVLRVSDAGQLWRIAVADTGPGIAPEKKDILFEPYVRGDSEQPGLGLGLATVKRLVEAHGGCVGVESVVGAGCTFWFELRKAPSAAVEGDREPPLRVAANASSDANLRRA